jgi:hypothetical protein
VDFIGTLRVLRIPEFDVEGGGECRKVLGELSRETL